MKITMENSPTSNGAELFARLRARENGRARRRQWIWWYLRFAGIAFLASVAVGFAAAALEILT